jgi:uncharacterized repeat protein (TIGR02543 family)
VKVVYSDDWPGGTLTVNYSNNVNAGTDTASASITVMDDSANTATATLNFSITQAEIAGTYTVSMDGYAYGGTVSTPTLSGEYTGGGTVTYYYNTTESNENGTAFADVTATTLEVGTYYLYAVIEETSNYQSYTTAATKFAVSNGSQPAPAASEATIDYVNETISFGADYEMNTSTDGGAETAVTSGSIITPGDTYYICAKEIANYNASDWTEITIPSRPAAPAGITGTAETSKGQTDGKITGLDANMEYSTDWATWTAITGTKLTGLTPGTYYVRYKAIQSTAFRSGAVSVTVGEGNTLTVTLDSNGGSEVGNIENLSYNAEAGTLPTPTRAGYTFGGWYNGETQLTATTKITTNVIYTAKWTLIAPTATSTGYTGTYDGTAHTISVTASHGAEGVRLTYQWYLGTTAISGATDSTYSVKNVADSGTYSCVVTATVNNESTTYTCETIVASITQATLTPSATASNKTYDGKRDAEATVSFAGLQNGETLTEGVDYTIGSANFADANAGSGKTVAVTVTLKDTVTNYTLSSTTCTTTASIAQATLTPSATASDKTYDGKTAAEATVSFAGLQNGETLSADDYTIGSANFADANAGENKTVAVTVTLKDTVTNYTLSCTTCTTTASITKATLTPSATVKDKTYDGKTDAEATVSFAGLQNGETLSADDYTIGSANFENANAGENKTVSVTVTLNNTATAKNYTLSSDKCTTTASITKATVNVTAVAASKTYGEADPTLTYTAGTLVNGNSLTGSLARTTGETVGEYDITVGTLSAGSNYTIHFTGATFTINKATVTVSEAIASAVYNGTVQTADIQNTDLYTVSENKGGTNVGDYNVKLTLKDSTNYAWSDSEGATKTLTFSITQATNEWTTKPSISGWTYGDAANAPAGVAKFGTVKVEYKVKGTEDSTYTTTVPTNAGDYTVRFTVEGTKNYTGLSEVRDLTIKQKDITNAVITLDSTLTYNGEAQTQSIKSVKVDNLDVTYTVSGDKQTNAGDYTLNITGNGNFTGTATKDWSIAAKNIADAEITLGDALTYNGKEQTQGIKSVKVDNLDVTYTVEGDKQTNAGSYTLTITGNGNFTGTAAKGWSIAAKNIADAEITLGDVLTYNGEAQTQSIKSVKVDNLDATYTVEGDKQANAGDYTLTITGNGNFTGTATKDWSIAAKNIAGAEITLGDVLTYNGEAQTQSIKSVTVDNLDVTYTVSGEKQTNAGGYTLTVTGNGNFTGTATKDWSVAAKALTITADSQTKKYSEADPELTYQVEGLVAGDTVTGSLTRTQGETVGTYEITQGTLDTGINYTITFTGAELTISKNPGATIATTITDDNGNTVVTKVNDANQIVETIVTDENGNVVEVVENEYWEESGNVHVVTVTDGEGNQTETQYADDGKTISVVTETDAKGNETKTEYAEDGQTVSAVTKTDTTGNVIKTEYAEDGQTVSVVTETDAKGNETKTEYTEDGKTISVVTETDATGNVTKTEYRAENTTVVTKYDAEGQQTERKTTYANGSYLLDGFDPELIEGDGSRYDGENPMPFRSNDELVNFLYVKLNGELLDAEHYQVSSGSIRVVLNVDFLDTLKPGTYTLSIVSTNGEASGTFTIPEKKDPVSLPVEEETKPEETSKPVTTTKPTDTTKIKDTAKPEKTTETVKAGDNSQLVLWVVMFLLSAGGAVGCTSYTRRKKEKKSK